MNTYNSVVMAAAGTIASLIWLLVFIRGSGKYGEIIRTKAASSLKFSSIIFTGFELMKIMKTDIRRGKYAEKRRNISGIYGERYAEFYTYLFTGAQISYSAFLIPVSLLAGALTDSVMLCVTGLAAAFLVRFVLDEEIKKKFAEKQEEMMCELPDAVMRLTLLMNAGMVLRDAWTMTAEASPDSALGAEMKLTGDDIRNGIPEQEAFEAFAERCRTKEIKKFTSLLVQNIKKGNMGLSDSLMMLAEEQREEKKNYARKKADAVEQKLLLPMIMIFAAVIIMIIFPVFSGML